MLEKINWGIIGCGEVTEKKSGPAFSKIAHSNLVAVMRRDEAKARDYASRHAVARYYSNADDLLNDAEVNAIYIATPPDSHEEYTLKALALGKPVYVEKPMALSITAAKRMAAMAEKTGLPLIVAHYRRAQPHFQKIKDLLNNGMIGQPRVATLKMYRRGWTADDLALPRNAWRVDPAISGGGLFHDLSPHQLDLFLHWFGYPVQVAGMAYNQAAIYNAADTVAGTLRFSNGLLLQGSWCFSVGANEEKDECCITGTSGSIRFSFFDRQEIWIESENDNRKIQFEALDHVQEPMIAQTVNHLRGLGPNPCPAAEAVSVMEIMEKISQMH